MITLNLQLLSKVNLKKGLYDQKEEIYYSKHYLLLMQEAVNCFITLSHLGFPGDSDSKESACSAGDLGSVPELKRCPGEGNGYPLQHSCLENSKDRGAWQATQTMGSQRVGHN